MQQAYLMVGKRFKAIDLVELNSQLAKYNLRTVSEDVCEGVEKPSDPKVRYLIQQSYGDPADFDEYDVVIGKEVGNNGCGEQRVIEKEPSELENIVNEVKRDIPDAKIIAGSYWI